MIYNLYVIDAGMCIYSYDFKQNIALNEQLFTGFLSAIGAFAQETFQEGLQTIQIRNNQKIAFSVDNDVKLMFCAIADSRDNNHLLQTILNEIAQKFVNQMRSVLEKNRSRVDEYKKFDSEMPKIIRYKTKSRDIKSMLIGLFIGLIELAFLTAWGTNLLKANETQLGSSVTLILFLIFFSLVLSIVSLTSGYFAGSPKFGTRTGIIFFMLLNFIILMMNLETFLNFLYISPFVLIACVAAGYAGGLICDRIKLYPLKK